MEKYIYPGLDVKRLLTLGDLDIRAVAAREEETTAHAFFTRLTRLILDAPSFREAVAGDGLAALRDRLTDIGCQALNPHIDGIGSAIAGGHLRLAEKLTDEAEAFYNNLLVRLKSVYSARKAAQTQAAGDGYREMTLNEALAALDEEEANRKLRVLAVDDVAVVLNNIVSILSPYYEVFALKNSSHVEKFLTHTTPELFLLDIEMNEMGGFELVPVIRRFAEHKDTPILFLTGNASLPNLKDAVALGACDFMAKPVNKDVLLAKIQENIVRKKAY